MKNYAFRAGILNGVLNSLKHDSTIIKLLEYDEAKLTAFRSLIDTRIAKAELESIAYESDGNSNKIPI